MPEMITRAHLVRQLLDMGVQPGGVLVVHTALSKVRLVEGGREGRSRALREALGPAGTLVMPGMTEDDDHPFDPRQTPCPGLWSPIPSGGCRACCAPTARFPPAAGAQAARITAPTRPDAPHGLNSPIGRVYELDGQVLLLGIDHTANTTIHLAESLSGVRYRRKKYVTCSRTASRRWTTARSTTAVRTLPWWMAGWTPGVCSAWEPWDARGRGWPAADVVAVVIERLRQDETAFRIPLGLTRNATKRWPAWKGEPDPLQAVRQQGVPGHRPGGRARAGGGTPAAAAQELADLGGQVRGRAGTGAQPVRAAAWRPGAARC